MKKVLFVLLASMAMTATAQNAVDVDAQCPKGPTCSLPCPRTCQQDSCPCPRMQQRKQTNRGFAFMNNLSETDRAAVKEIMTQFHNEHKAIMEKCRAQRPAKGVKLTDKQKDEINKARIANRTEMMKLQSKYYDKLRKTLSPEQASRILGMNGNRVHRGKVAGRNGNRRFHGNRACHRPANCPRANK